MRYNLNFIHLWLSISLMAGLLLLPSAYADTIFGATIDCTNKDYFFCDDFSDASVNTNIWKLPIGGCTEGGGMLTCPDIGSGDTANSLEWSTANETLTTNQPFCIEYVTNYTSVTSTEIQYAGFAKDGYGSLAAGGFGWMEVNAAGAANGYQTCTAADVGCTSICGGSMGAGQKVHVRICYLGGSAVFEGSCYNATTDAKINAVNKTHTMALQNSTGYWSLNWQGANSYDYMVAWNGYATDAPYIATDIKNTSFNVTNYQDLISNSSAWNSNGYINISTNRSNYTQVLAFTFDTQIAVNASCSIHNLNYTDMVARNANYKLSTTMSKTHSYTLFDNLSYYNSSTNVYCAYYDGLRAATSGPLKTMLSDIEPPRMQRLSQQLPILTFTNMITKKLEISYNATDANNFTALLYFKTNYSDADYGHCVLGVCSAGFENKTYNIQQGTNYTWLLDDNRFLPSWSYNIDEEYMENTSHLAFTSTDSVKIQFYNVSATRNKGFYEVMSNSSVAGDVITVRYCNSTYTTGNIISSPYCAVFGQSSLTNYNHTHSIYSAHKVFPFIISGQKMNGVTVTPLSYFIVSHSTTGQTYYITNNTATAATSPNGIAWAALPGTVDSHLHQFDNDTRFYYKLCGNDTYKNSNCSILYNSTFNVDRLPPTSVNIFSPKEQGYRPNVTINYSNSSVFEPADSYIQYFMVRLYDQNFNFIQDIVNNSQFLNYTWNASVTDNYYRVGVQAYDNFTLSANSFSPRFYIDTAPPTCTDPRISAVYPGENSTVMATIEDVFNVSWIAIFENNTLFTNISPGRASYNLSASINISTPPNSSVRLSINYSDALDNRGSCLLNLTVGERVISPNPDLLIGGCPKTLVSMIIIFTCVFVALFFISLGYVMKNYMLCGIGWVLLMIPGWYLIGCIPIFSGIIMLISAVMLIFTYIGYKGDG